VSEERTSREQMDGLPQAGTWLAEISLKKRYFKIICIENFVFQNKILCLYNILIL
jgi:hypothetical protein